MLTKNIDSNNGKINKIIKIVIVIIYSSLEVPLLLRSVVLRVKNMPESDDRSESTS